MPVAPFPLTPEKLEAIARNALAALTWRPETLETILDEDSGRKQAAFEALRFVFVAAGRLGTPIALPFVRQAAPVTLDHIHCDGLSDSQSVAEGLRLLLSRETKVTRFTRRAARHVVSAVRLAVATALRPRDEAATDLLRELARDSSPAVRAAARQSLGPANQVPWWWGVFRSDPLARSHATETRDLPELRALLDEVVALMGKDRFTLDRENPDLGDLLVSLPAELAMEAAECCLRRPDAWASGGMRTEALLAMIEHDEDGRRIAALLCDLVRRERGELVVVRLAGDLKRLDADVAHRACIRMLSTVREWAPRVGDGRCLALCRVIGGLLPEGADARPLLEALAGVPIRESLRPGHIPPGTSDEAAGVLMHVAHWLERCDLEAVADELCDIHEAGYPGDWYRSKWPLESLLCKLHSPRIRQIAQAALVGKGDPAWGLLHLIGAGHDPDRDPPIEVLLQRALNDDRLRGVVLEHAGLLDPVLPQARELLRAGALTPAHAATVIERLGRPWPAWPRRPYHDADSERAKMLERRSDVPPPPDTEDLAGLVLSLERGGPHPLTTRLLLIESLPPGPWTEQQRAWVDELFEAYRTEPDPEERSWFECRFSRAVRRKPDAEMLRRVGAFLEAAMRGKSTSASLLLQAYRDTARALGLDPTPPRGLAEAPSGWMDEDDDEGEE